MPGPIHRRFLTVGRTTDILPARIRGHRTVISEEASGASCVALPSPQLNNQTILLSTAQSGRSANLYLRLSTIGKYGVPAVPPKPVLGKMER